MPIRPLLGKLRWAAISAANRRDFKLPKRGLTVSFTFDDFPKSALHVGGKILESAGVRGTYYAAVGLMDTVTSVGPIFSAADIEALLSAGHELGSHTYNHLSCRATALPDFRKDAEAGKRAVDGFVGVREAHHFSYPYGEATALGKGKVGEMFSSCRGIVPGVNVSPVDLNLLRANRIYSGSFEMGKVERLLQEGKDQAGWVIFYTHDVAEKPSEFGCRPEEFEGVVRAAERYAGEIVPVGRVVSRRTAGNIRSTKQVCQ